ncbi:MAG: hypothetical protein ABI811_17980 [Acidobacteriota bacterium]
MKKWIPTGLGAEPKKLMLLAALLVSVPLVYYVSNGSGGSTATAPVTAVAPGPLPAAGTRPVTPRPAPKPAAGRNTEDFKPSLKLPEDFDLSKVDPTLRTDLLTKVREVGEAGASRSLFEFYTPPPPPPPVKPINPTPPPVISTGPAKPAEPVKLAPPPPPPIPLKYFGYVGTPRGGSRLLALFVDGEDTFAVAENDMIRNRYRVVRAGLTSAEVEDTVAKNTQTLRIVERYEDKAP